MSEARKGKKRPKSYYIKCAKGKRQKRINDLDVGMKGFLITCNTHEKEAVRESYNILNEYADKLYGPEVKPRKDDVDSDSESGSDDDIEKAMAKEASEIKDRAPAQRRFQNVDCKAKNCIFIKTTLDSPTELAHAIFTDLETNKVQKTRHAIRMLPITTTCKAVMKNIEEAAETLFKPYFETEFGIGVKYTSVCKIRNNQNISRMAILPNLGRIIKEMNPLHMLCYDEPELVILVEVLRNICCLSVVKGFFKFRKYNLHEVVKTNENGEPVSLKDLSSDEKDAKVERTELIDRGTELIDRRTELIDSCEKSIETENSEQTGNCKNENLDASVLKDKVTAKNVKDDIEDNNPAPEVKDKTEKNCDKSAATTETSRTAKE